MHIQNITIDDNDFSCKASNSLGESTMEFKFDISPSEPLNVNTHSNRTKPQFNFVIPSGTSISIECPIASGESRWSILWEEELTNSTKMLSNEKTVVNSTYNYILK